MFRNGQAMAGSEEEGCVMRARKLVTVGAVLVLACLIGCQMQSRIPGFSEAEKNLQRSKYAEAVAGYEAFLVKNAQSPLGVVAQYRIGECNAGMGRTPEAIAAFQKVIANYPNETWAKWAKEDIETLKKQAKEKPKVAPKPAVKKPPAKKAKAKAGRKWYWPFGGKKEAKAKAKPVVKKPATEKAKAKAGRKWYWPFGGKKEAKAKPKAPAEKAKK